MAEESGVGKSSISTVAVVGAGVIGRSWVKVFARAACATRLYDPEPRQLQSALEWLDADLERDRADGLIPDGYAARLLAGVVVCSTLEEAVAGADWVQESGPEDIELKKSIFARLDRVADTSAILASSTSSLDMTLISVGLPGARRCLVAHPINPPHVIPVVEILPGRETRPETVERASAFLAGVGQMPVRLNFYVRGFLSSRLHIALLREAIDLVDREVADVEAVDTVIREGLGLRWAVLGPFAVADTNADGGVKEYLTRYERAYREVTDDLGDGPLCASLIDRLSKGADATRGAATRGEIRRWRDRMIAKIRTLKVQNPRP